MVLEVTVIEGEPGAVGVKSGERLLAESAVSKVMAWHFKPGTNASFTTTFSYQLERRKARNDQLPVIAMPLPEFVHITAPNLRLVMLTDRAVAPPNGPSMAVVVHS
ncbi:MAG: hypothetical protein ACUVRY_05815 [Thermoanaerobaculaceae bacterium]